MEKKRTKRESLCGRNRGKPKAEIDMEEVYEYLNEGHTLKQATVRFGVCENTLRRHHAQYQKEIDTEEKAEQNHDCLGLTKPVDLP